MRDSGSKPTRKRQMGISFGAGLCTGAVVTACVAVLWYAAARTPEPMPRAIRGGNETADGTDGAFVTGDTVSYTGNEDERETARSDGSVPAGGLLWPSLVQKRVGVHGGTHVDVLVTEDTSLGEGPVFILSNRGEPYAVFYCNKDDRPISVSVLEREQERVQVELDPVTGGVAHVDFATHGADAERRRDLDLDGRADMRFVMGDRASERGAYVLLGGDWVRAKRTDTGRVILEEGGGTPIEFADGEWRRLEATE